MQSGIRWVYNTSMISLPATVQKIIADLNTSGFEIFAVGGSVRDSLMNKNTHGWDLTTNATPEQILNIFPDSFYDNQFGTVGIKIYDKKSIADNQQQTTNKIIKPDDIYEITTYRSDKGYTDFRHPDQVVWGKTLLEDLSRRDLTINAIATDGTSIIDPYHGQDDIKNRIITTVGNADDRFKEDALRMMRAVRIAAQLGFILSEQTRQAIIRNATLITKISAERIRDELLKLLSADFAADGILILKNTGILKLILPELEATFLVGQKSPKRHHLFDVGTHSVEALKACPSPDPIVRLATLLHDIGKPKTYRITPEGVITFFNHEVVGAKMIKAISLRLRLSNKEAEKLYILTRWHQFSVDEKQTDSAIRRIIRRVGKENMDDMLSLRIGDRLGGGALETSWRLELFKKRLVEVQKQPFSISDLKINGYDVMKTFSVKPGPIIGKILQNVFNEVEKGTLQNDREILITKLETWKSKSIFSADSTDSKE
jgi:tRNA nucleotidyltransferase (CCA-adding enzyme)